MMYAFFCGMVASIWANGDRNKFQWNSTVFNIIKLISNTILYGCVNEWHRTKWAAWNNAFVDLLNPKSSMDISKWSRHILLRTQFRLLFSIYRSAKNSPAPNDNDSMIHGWIQQDCSVSHNAVHKGSMTYSSWNDNFKGMSIFNFLSSFIVEKIYCLRYLRTRVYLIWVE